MLWRLLRAVFKPESSAAPLIQRALGLRRAGDFAGAERVLREALAQHPRDAVAATNLAVALLEQDHVKEAAALLERAIELDPRCAAAHFNYANLHRVAGRLAEAIAHYRLAKTADPDFAAAPEELMQTLLEACDWDGARAEADELRERIARAPAGEWMRRVSPLTAEYLGLNREQRKAVAAFHASQFLPSPPGRGSALRANPAGGFTNPSPFGRGVGGEGKRGEGKRSDRIRIAYFSRDFRDHPVGHVLRGVFALHDRARFDVSAFSFGVDDGSVYRNAIAQSVDRFVDVARMSDEEAARAIAEAQVDILVDLMGHTTGNRLGVLARRPAPVQAHYLGYAGTTGAPYIDYFMSDEVATPAALRADFTEEVAYVPECFMAADGLEARTAVPVTRHHQKLPPEGFVFSNFGNPSRITHETFALWMRILDGVPGSVLWLRRAHPLVVENLGREAHAAGVDAKRLIFAERVPEKSMHLGRLALADLVLDTLGWYNGHSSTADMLWAGVPVLTSPGATFASRVAASLVIAAGFPQLAAPDHAAYVSLALHLAGNREAGGALRQALGQARDTAPFFDTTRRVRGLERAYEAMYAAKMHATAGL